MRLKRLDLQAFGPFTDRTIEFNSDAPGLHIVFGANEAGKSSSLRALKALLFGFPERTSDNFQHANNQLLVGGCLQNADGREINFSRRKKRKANLLDLDGNPLDPNTLSPYLQGIEPDLFQSLFGIDHQSLVEGGADILAQKGAVGQALFAAGAGISSLNAILESLDAEANDLFKSTGSKQKITQAIKEYKELTKVVKESSLASSKWKSHQRQLHEAEAALATLEDTSKQKSIEMQRLDRLHKAIPELAELENLQQQLQNLGDVVILPSEFPEQHRVVEQSLREIKLQLNQGRERLKKIKTKQESISLNKPLLDHAETIEDLHQRLDSYRKGQKDRSRLDGMRITHRKEAGELIREVKPELRLEDADSLRPVLSRKRTIQDLCSKHEALHQQALHAQKKKSEVKRTLQDIDDTLSNLPAIRNHELLSKSLKLTQRLGDIDGHIEDITREIKTEETSCQAELTRLGLWAGELDQLRSLPLPRQETVRHYDNGFNDLDKERQQLAKDRTKAETDLKAARVEEKEVAYGGEVPSEKDLQASRKKRQEGWLLLRRNWLTGEDITQEAAQYDPGQDVHDAYEKYVEQADHIADRLRREAERVAKASSLRAKIEGFEEAIKELIQQQQEVNTSIKELDTRWQSEWEAIHITPLSPREMLAWLADIDALRLQVTMVFNKEEELAERKKARQQFRELLIKELNSLEESESFTDKTLAPVQVFAESVVEEIKLLTKQHEKLNEKRTQAQKLLSKAEEELKDAETAREEWSTMWDRALAGLDLKENILPNEALALLETIGSCFDKLKNAKEFQSRISGIDRDMEQFCHDVRYLVQQTCPDLIDLLPDQTVLQLHAMLGKSRQDNELAKKNHEDTEALTLELQNTTNTQKSLERQMEKILQTAKCKTEAELEEAKRRSLEYQRLQEKISNAETSLAKVSEGVPVEVIKQQSSEVDRDQLPSQISSLKRHIEEELYPQIKEQLRIIGEENRELQHMDGSSKAAEAAEKKEQVASKIVGLVDQYTLRKLASTMLKDEIERYREQHQGPILQAASRIFSTLTLGSFSGLLADVNDKGEPVLVGIRPEGLRIEVEGMSSGTCDQLYLALRLATLESRLQTSEPMPFIVDDILINFDDDRSRATLEVLADLAQKNQIILFTHHNMVVTEATKMTEDKPVYIYEL